MALIRLRLVLLAAMGLMLALIASRIFGATQPSLLVVPAVTFTFAVLAADRSFKTRALAAFASVPGAVIAAVLIADGKVSDAGTAILDGPKQLLSTEWPSPVTPTLIATVAVLIALAMAWAMATVSREGTHLAPLGGIIAGLTACIALAAPTRPPNWQLAILGLLAVLFGLSRPGESLKLRCRSVFGDRTLAMSAVAIVAIVIGGSGLIAWAERSDPRRTEDASISATLIDPLEATAAMRAAQPPVELFRLTDRSELIVQSLPIRWRLAALDTYDGQRWVPTVTLRPIGRQLGIAAPSGPDVVPPIRYTIDVLTDDLDVVPFPGPPLTIEAAVETDRDRTVVRLTERPSPGTSIDASASIAPTQSIASTSDIVRRQVDEMAGTFTDLATNLGGEGTIFEQLRRIETTMHDEWQLDSRAPGNGQQLALVERFLTETRRGSEEQFVTGFVLLVRSLGYDARIATGFVVPPGSVKSPLILNSAEAAVWPEVHSDHAGWVAFDPTPSTETTDVTEPPPPPEAQSPAAAQPPIVPPTETGDKPPVVNTDRGTDVTGWQSVRAWAVRVGMISGISLVPVLAAVGTIVYLKWRRRRRRLRLKNPADRIRGAWANATDSLVDAGLAIEQSWTNDTIAAVSGILAPTVPHEIRRLASMSTAMTFGSTDEAPRLINDATYTAHVIDEAIRLDRTQWGRLKWRLSLRSLRASTRSPVLPA